MNYKSKLLSVFLSAGILLNSTSMAFAGQDDVNAKSGDQHTESTENVRFVKNARLATVKIPRWIKSIGESTNFDCYLSHLELPEGLRSRRDKDPYERFLNYPKELANEGREVFAGEWRSGVEWSAKQKGNEWSPDMGWIYNERTKTLYIWGKNGCILGKSDDCEYNWWRYIDKYKVEHLVINGVDVIEEGAFEDCTGLKTLELSEGLTYIKNRAFFGCKKLTTVNMPKSLERIGARAFANCDITSPIKLSERFKFMYVAAFANNEHLKTVEILGCIMEDDELYKDLLFLLQESSFTPCEDGTWAAFDGCKALTSVNLNKRYKPIKRFVLGDAKDNEGLKIEYTE